MLSSSWNIQAACFSKLAVVTMMMTRLLGIHSTRHDNSILLWRRKILSAISFPVIPRMSSSWHGYTHIHPHPLATTTTPFFHTEFGEIFGRRGTFQRKSCTSPMASSWTFTTSLPHSHRPSEWIMDIEKLNFLCRGILVDTSKDHYYSSATSQSLLLS